MIETKRLMLMKINSGDLEVISKILSSPTQTKFLPNQAPYSDEHQRKYLFNRIEHWSKYGFKHLSLPQRGCKMKVEILSDIVCSKPKVVDILVW